jgi:4-hydroxy-3-methylbut-2-enyl diphosphate reductase
VVTALRLEERAVRRRVRGVNVIRGGVSLERLIALERVVESGSKSVLVSIGLAGGLADEHPTGTVIIPERIESAAGESWRSDATWTAALRGAAHRLGLPAATGPLVETTSVVTGAERAQWAGRGYVAADMESASVAALAPQFAAVRVVLDTPTHEISPRWRQPARAVVDPRLWSQGFWLMRTAPRLADRAAAVLAEALRGQTLHGDVDAQV